MNNENYKSQINKALSLAFIIPVIVIGGLILLSIFSGRASEYFRVSKWFVYIGIVVVVQLGMVIYCLGKIILLLEGRND